MICMVAGHPWDFDVPIQEVFLRCLFTNAQTFGNKGRTYFLTSAYNCTVWRSPANSDITINNRLQRDHIPYMRLERIQPTVLKVMASMIVRLSFLSVKNGKPYQEDLWEMEKS